MLLRQISLTVAALTLASSAAAQPAGTWEMGAVGRYSGFADILHLDDEYGGGAFIGFFPLARLELEVAASLTSTVHSLPPVGDAIYVPVKARLTYNQPLLSFVDLRIGAGYIFNTYRIDPDWYGDSGVTALLGARFHVSRRVALLLSGTGDYLPAYSDRTDVFDELVSWGLEAGISVLLGGRPRAGGAPVVATTEAAEEQQIRAPTDGDGDGIPDDADRCPGTPAGITVGADGCPPPVAQEPAPTEEALPPPEPDGDGDGVPDSRDRCPETAAGTEVDAEGCPLTRDSDGDGVFDSEDRCDDTPPGSEVDPVGCPILTDTAAVEATLEGAFRSGTWGLTSSAEQTLDSVARVMLAHPTLRIEIAGYTDNLGEERRNLWLSQTRADAVKLYLSKRGVARDRMVTRGYGPADPVASNQTPEGRARNRRVEIRRIR
ncbi:MAG: OmpA family protein [Gemmatimonadales bacterium]|jgi:outer membrane protein OmpA-like peptidoglycan-associated protein